MRTIELVLRHFRSHLIFLKIGIYDMIWCRYVLGSVDTAYTQIHTHANTHTHLCQPSSKQRVSLVLENVSVLTSTTLTSTTLTSTTLTRSPINFVLVVWLFCIHVPVNTRSSLPTSTILLLLRISITCLLHRIYVNNNSCLLFIMRSKLITI